MHRFNTDSHGAPSLGVETASRTSHPFPGRVRFEAQITCAGKSLRWSTRAAYSTDCEFPVGVRSDCPSCHHVYVAAVLPPTSPWRDELNPPDNSHVGVYGRRSPDTASHVDCCVENSSRGCGNESRTQVKGIKLIRDVVQGRIYGQPLILHIQSDGGIVFVAQTGEPVIAYRFH